MTVLTDLMNFIDRELDAIEAERKRRKMIRDEGNAHFVIEKELEREQIIAGQRAALFRVLNQPSAWDQLTERDMSF